MAAFDVDRMKGQAQRYLGGFTTGQKMLSLLAVAALLLGALFFTSWISKPSYSTLYSNLDPKDASSITDQLTSKGVSYQLANGGQTIMVPKSKVYQLRLDMGAAGLPSGGSNSGYPLLDKQGITTSEFSQRVNYQRAIEGELAKTIGSLQDVRSAQVHLVVQSQDVFSDDSEKPSASILVATSGSKRLSATQVRAIVHLTASAVSGMKPDDVTVADTQGNVLSAPGQDANAATDDGSTVTSKYEAATKAKVENLLNRVIGPGHAVVQVSATLNLDKSAKTSETYENPSTTGTPLPPIASSTTDETFVGSGGAARGNLGNEPEAGTTLPTGSGDYSRKTNNSQNPLNKTVTKTSVATGAVEKQTIAVIVDSKVVKAGEASDLETQIGLAAGIDPARGDVARVQLMKFDQSLKQDAEKLAKDAKSAESKDTLMSIIKTVLILLFTAVVLFLARRNIKKAAASRPPIRVPLDLRQIEAGQGMMFGDERLTASMIAEAGGGELVAADVQAEVRQMIERQPDEVAATLRSWLADRRT